MKINFVEDIFEGETYEDGRVYRKDIPPGSAQYVYGQDGKPHVLYFVCPCGCGVFGGLPIAGGGWKWDGNIEAPTCSPSVLLPSCGWHGWLVAGEWKSV